MGVRLDLTWDDIRERVDRAATSAGEWAGAPLPLDNNVLVIEPRYPFVRLNGARLDRSARELIVEARIKAAKSKGEIKNIVAELSADITFAEATRERLIDAAAIAEMNQDLRASFFSHRLRSKVYICNRDDGRVEHFAAPSHPGESLRMSIETLGTVGQAHTATAEATALKSLRNLVSEHAWSSYFLSGMFLETSKRSRVTYLFRKLRPTVAMSTSSGHVKFLACLCLHPIGYYESTWTGTLCPTDDVIAHLLLMRSDERKYWAKANHHGIFDTESGL